MFSFTPHTSLPSVLSLLVGGSSLGWMVRAMGLAASAVAVGAWFRSRSQATKEVQPPSGDAVADEAASEPSSPHAPTPSPSPPAKVEKKKKKSVAFALERNETRLVDKWYINTWGHKHPTRPNGRVGIHEVVLVMFVANWLQPDGHNQLHFPRTKWIRDVPDWDVEDDDGDIGMLDC